MAYTDINFKTKKALRAAILAGDTVRVVSAGFFGAKTDGTEFVEGPHYPAAHAWYAQVRLSDGKIVSVK